MSAVGVASRLVAGAKKTENDRITMIKQIENDHSPGKR